MKYEITAPDGRRFEITAPDGATQEQVLSFAQQSWDRRKKEGEQRKAEGEADMRRMADPASGMNFTEKFNAGMGKAFTDLARGAGQLVGMGPSAEEVKETRQLDAPLMSTGAGTAGNIAGNVAAIAPAALLPGASAIPAAGALGAATAALQPTESTGERLVNMGKGGALQAGVQAVGGPVAQWLGQRQGAQEAIKQSAASRNAVRDQTLREGQEAGLVVPPSSVNPSFLNKRLEGFAGKAAVGQEASIRNQQGADSLSRRAAQLGPDEAMSETALRGARTTAAAPYREVAGLNQQASAELETWKAANAEAKLQWNYYGRSGQPDAYKAAQAAQQQAETALNNIEQIAQQSGRPELVKALREARPQIAKIREVENAVNTGTGSVDPSVLGRALDNGAPLSGELKTLAKFQQAFPQYTREASRIGTPGVSATESAASAALGMSGAALTGNPAGALAGGVPMLRGPARSLIFSKPYQAMMAQPKYQAPFLTGGGPLLPANDPRYAQLVRALSLPATVDQ